MFERFTERARRVIVLAQEETRMLGHMAIGTEHLLLGLLREEEGVAAQVLARLDVSEHTVRTEVVRQAGAGNGASSAKLPFTPHARTALELSLREALIIGDNYIGTEHLLLGLVRQPGTTASRMLPDACQIAGEVYRFLDRPPPEPGLLNQSRHAGPPPAADTDEEPLLGEELDDLIAELAAEERVLGDRLLLVRTKLALLRHHRDEEDHPGRGG